MVNCVMMIMVLRLTLCYGGKGFKINLGLRW